MNTLFDLLNEIAEEKQDFIALDDGVWTWDAETFLMDFQEPEDQEDCVLFKQAFWMDGDIYIKNKDGTSSKYFTVIEGEWMEDGNFYTTEDTEQYKKFLAEEEEDRQRGYVI